VKALEIHLKSGGVFTVDAIDLSTKRTVADGELTSIEWTTPEGAKRKLHHVSLESIVALVVIA